jgi:hypothetical protein
LVELWPLQAQHLSLIAKWLNEPHVGKWFGNPNSRVISLDSIKTKLLPRINKTEAVYCFIIAANNTAIGYIQWYDAISFTREA